ncbi:MAG: alpha/beta hydrolase [Alphaproteobacteria bacterium]
MPLNPQVEAILAQLAENPTPPITELAPPDARALYKAMSAATDTRDIPIGKVINGTFPGPDGDVPYRLYSPVAAVSVMPGLVYYHGGGWVIGDLDTHDSLCRDLANASGCRVFAVDYRLAPEHPFPAAVDDAMAALQFVNDNAPDLGIDPNALAVGGDSAGGNLAAVVAQQARHSGKARVMFQLLIYPVTEALPETVSMNAHAEGYLLEKATMTWFVHHYVHHADDIKNPRVSPLCAEDVSGLAPAYVITAEYDPLRDEGRAYAEKLKAAGVPTTYVEYPGMIHGFMAMGGVLDEARAALADAGAAVKDALDAD